MFFNTSIMKNPNLKAILPLSCAFLLAGFTAMSQTVVQGTVLDAEQNEPLIGVNIVVKGKVTGTITDTRGDFRLSVNEAPPFTLVFSSVGFNSTTYEVTKENTTGLEIAMKEETLLGQEVVVSASRLEESILESPVTIEKMDIIDIQQSSAPDFYDAIANLKGVHVNQGSLNFPAINTRGFGAIANERFVQLVDGMDNAAPLLNFPTGNLTGLSEIDVESVELLPGAASALYGPNAFNGILIMNSKSPFEYQGLSAQVKAGLTQSDAQGQSYPLYSFSARYAKSFLNDKMAFKVNFSYFDAQDWLGNDYTTDRNAYRQNLAQNDVPNQPGDPNFDGMNTYGDETEILLPLGAVAGPSAASLGTLDLRRTGFTEEELIEDFSASSLKADAALHYKITNEIEAIAAFRYGGGNSIYQGGEKYVLRGFNQNFAKVEVRSPDFFVRAYRTEEDAGDSYNLTALGAFVNESIAPSAARWVPTYVESYLLANQGYINGVPAGNSEAAHEIARGRADAPITAARETGELDNIIDQVRSDRFQTENGARLVARSRLYHGEFNYNFASIIDVLDIQVGGNVRRYDLFSDGTVFNEDPDGSGTNERITIDEFGVYTQLSKKLFDENLKLTGSIRYDKNENFDGQITPRVSAVYTFLDNQNIRASFQTGFRNPQTQAQFLYFPASTGILLGSTEANAARYGIHNGGAWSESSYQNWVASGSPVDENGNPTGLETVTLDFVQPEQLQSYEIGYKGVIANKVLLDVNYYYSIYTDFLAQQTVRSKEATDHQGEPLPALTAFRPYVNAEEEITSQGIGLGFTYKLPSDFEVSGNYSWATFNTDADEDFQAGFNTPENRYTVTFANRKLADNLGFSATFRYQDEFLWQNSFGEALVPAFGTFDAQVSYKVESIKSVVKVGGTNLIGGDYRTNIAAPFVGSKFFVSVTFDEFLN